MEDNIKSNKSINLGEILKQSLFLYKENICLFIGITILGNALTLLPIMQLSFIPDTIRGTVSFITTLASVFISFWANIAFIIAVTNRYSNNRVTLKECFLKTKGSYWRFIGIYVMYFLFLGAGLLLFVIPGIYLGTIFVLAPIAVVLEKKDIRPFGISRALIKGSFWKVFLLNLIAFVPIIICHSFIGLTKINYYVARLLVNTFLVLCASYFLVAMVILYHRLKEKMVDEQSPQKVPIKRGSIGCFGAIGLIILIFMLAALWTRPYTSAI